MRANRYRLRFVVGVTVSGGTYGGGNYGDGTYGQRASDPLEHPLYVPVPLPAGYPTTPSWMYRRGDTRPAFRAQILASTALIPLGLTGVSVARLLLVPVTEGGIRKAFSLEFEDRPLGIVRRDWVTGDLDVKGTYTATIVLDYNSGRRLTVPHDSRLVFVIGDQDVLP